MWGARTSLRLPAHAAFHRPGLLPTGNLQWRLKSDSKRIFEGLRANKQGLSKELDTVLRNSHDMRIFGVGFVRSCANLAEYRHFMTAHYHFYAALEEALDTQERESAVGRLWHACPELHGATVKLREDLDLIGASTAASPSPATAAYVAGIRRAAATEEGTMLISHFYTRYLADLFGGSMLGYPTRAALGLPADAPRFYRFPSSVEDNRSEYIEHVYASINAAGERLDEDSQGRLVQEAREAFAHNAEVYAERPYFYMGALAGGANIMRGLISHRMFGEKKAAVAPTP